MHSSIPLILCRSDIVKIENTVGTVVDILYYPKETLYKVRTSSKTVIGRVEEFRLLCPAG